MDELTILQYGSIAVIILLLVIFEILNRHVRHPANNYGYVYYTCQNTSVRIKHLFGSRYKVYVQERDVCPATTKRDRYGIYFLLKARSALDAEYRIDDLYRV